MVRRATTVLETHYPRLGRTWVNNIISSGYASPSSSSKTGTRRIMRLDEVSSVVRLEQRTAEHSSSTRIICLVPVFMLDERQDTQLDDYTWYTKFIPHRLCLSSIKTAILT